LDRIASLSNNLIGIKEVAGEEQKFFVCFLISKIKEEK
jgi:hypothetical protein